MTSSSWTSCPDCGQALNSKANFCWMCYRPFTDPPKGPPPFNQGAVAEDPSANRPAAAQFGLDTVMLTVTLVAVMLGVFSLAPGLGVLLLLGVIPAYLRTCITASRSRAQGKPMSPSTKMFAFGSNFMIAITVAVAVVVAAVIALVAVCFMVLAPMSM